ncbi:MAG: hypothetical protein M9962_14660 [Oligoflexia bacterium]|nr:hypothetical protein [Oligoflexia bacterium]
MKILSFLLTFSIFAGVFTSIDRSCFEEHQNHSAVSQSMDADHSRELPSEHHSGTKCHTCHVGHCSFIVLNSTATVAAFKNIAHSPKSVTPLFSEALSNLFRPPIA